MADCYNVDMKQRIHGRKEKIYVYIVTKMRKYYCVFGEYVIQSLYEIDYIRRRNERKAECK